MFPYSIYNDRMIQYNMYTIDCMYMYLIFV